MSTKRHQALRLEFFFSFFMLNSTDCEIYPAYFSLLINVKMPTIVGILTVISRINKTSESIKARKYQYFLAFYE